jgi:serine/threonine-protein kinase
MVLELLKGAELRHSLVERGAEDRRGFVGWMLQVCEGLAAAHVEGIIHRDLKPENLFITTEGDGTQVVKVLDFGIARSMQLASSVTREGERIGSPGYMSPEQIKDVRGVDERSDIWSLGVIMYEGLAGVAPFRAEGAIQVCVEILTAPVVPLGTLRPDLSPELVAVVERCMQRAVEARFANVADLADALAPHAYPAGADIAVRIRRRLGSRADALAPVSAATASAAVPSGVLSRPLETSATVAPAQESPVLLLTRSRALPSDPMKEAVRPLAQLGLAAFLPIRP